MTFPPIVFQKAEDVSDCDPLGIVVAEVEGLAEWLDVTAPISCGVGSSLSRVSLSSSSSSKKSSSSSSSKSCPQLAHSTLLRSSTRVPQFGQKFGGMPVSLSSATQLPVACRGTLSTAPAETGFLSWVSAINWPPSDSAVTQLDAPFSGSRNAQIVAASNTIVATFTTDHNSRVAWTRKTGL